MGYIIGATIADNIENYASTSALSSEDVTAITDGTLAQVTGGYLYQLFKNGTETVDASLVLSATGGGQWQEVFTYTGRNYLLFNPSDNTLSNISLASITNTDISASAGISYSKLAALTTNKILAGVSNVATVCTVAGDLTLSAATTTATFTIANDAVTTAKILDDNVTLAKLAPGITPAAILSAAGTGSYAGGTATATFTVAGLTAGDLVVASIATSANAVSIQKVSFSGTTVSVLCSGDPGSSTFTYHVARAAA